MLDKISLGTGKSRVTVLKYLNTLHAQSILDFKIIGRNKLWLLCDSTGGVKPEQPLILKKNNQNSLSSLVLKASELHELTLRRMDLFDYLDRSDRLVLTLTLDFTIISANQPFYTQFPDTYLIRELIPPDGIGRFEHGVWSAFQGEIVEMNLELQEKTGILRMYKITLFPSKENNTQPFLVVIGEDISFYRTHKQQEALLYLIRSTANIHSQDELFPLMMTGINNSILSYQHAILFLSDYTVAYSTIDISQPLKQTLIPLLERTAQLCETQVIGINNRDNFMHKLNPDLTDLTYLIIIPLLEGEQTIGTIVLLTSHEIRHGDVENVEIIADEIANFLKIQRLENERSEIIHTLKAINRISEILSSDHNEESLLIRIIDDAMKTLGFDMGCVYLTNTDTDLIPTVQRNMPDKLRDFCMSGHFSSIFKKACEDHSVLYLNHNNPDFLSLGPDIRHLGVKTILILPIVFGNTILGLLNMGSKEEKIYQKASLDNISSLGMQLGTALERTRLAHTLKQGNRE